MASTRTRRTASSPARAHYRRRIPAAGVVALGVLGAPAQPSASAAGPVTPPVLVQQFAREAAPAGLLHTQAAGAVVGGALLGSAGLVVAPHAGVPAPPAVLAHSFVVADAETGQVLAAKGAHVKSRPASTLKTLTALTLQPRLDPAQVYTARRADADIEGSRVGIVAGGTYTVRDLFHGLFLRSGNDAASALANAAGGQQSTVDAMNEVARSLGAYDTTARNPSGLDAPDQLTSAYDLALLGRAALSNPVIQAYAVTRRRPFPGSMPRPGAPRPHYEIQNKQQFVLDYPGALGIKNGYTNKARGTLIAAARRGGRTVLVTLLRSEGNIWREAAVLADWAFAHGLGVAPVGRLVTAADLRPAAAPASDAAGPGGGAAGPGPAARAATGIAAISRLGLPGRPAAVATAAGVAGGSVVGLLLAGRRRRRRRSVPPQLGSYGGQQPARR